MIAKRGCQSKLSSHGDSTKKRTVSRDGEPTSTLPQPKIPVIMIYNYRNLPIRANVKVPRFLLYFGGKINALTRDF